LTEAATKILEESLGKIVLVRLKGSKSIRGKLASFDQHMNLVLEDAEDVSQASENVEKLGVIIVRGDNVVIISPPPR
jgi:small nuclear ribonucleoprotein